jgi:hypothetical protein
MKAKILRKSGKIEKGATVEVGAKTGTNKERGPEDVGGTSTTSAPVYAVTDEEGQTENVDTRDMKVER